MKAILFSLLALLLPWSAWAGPAPKQPQPGTSTKSTPKPTPRALTKPTWKSTQQNPAGKTAGTQAPHRLFQRANQLYNQGSYRKAAQMLEQLIASKEWANFAVFYNLGNSYVRLQQYGLALAYYRKAQRLHPNHLNLLHNIQMIYRRLGKTEAQQGGIRIKFLFWYYLLDLKMMFYTVVFLTSFALFLWAVYIRRKSRGLLGLRWPLAAFGTFTLIMWLSLSIKLYQERYRTSGIIIQPRVTARSGYGTQFEPLFRLTEADEVTVKKQLDVATPNGKQSWLRIEATIYSKKEKRRVRQSGWIPAQAIKTI